MKLLEPKYIKLIIFIYACLVTFINNNIIHMLSYIFVAIFFTISIITKKKRKRLKIGMVILYFLLASMQIVHVVFSQWSVENAVFAILLLIPSFLIEIYFLKNEKRKAIKSWLDDKILTFKELKQFNKVIESAVQKIQETGETVTIETIEEIIKDLPRNSSTRYINKDSLSQEYFEKAYESLEDEYVYITIADTGSPVSRAISVITNTGYNHASIAFDRELDTLVSYNAGERIYPPGLNAETLKCLQKKEDASVLVYRLKVSKEQKQRMIEKVKLINEEGNAYNVAGLFVKKSFKPNIMVCSQFVYTILEDVGVNYFEKDRAKIKPTDFIQLDYERKLEFVEKISLNLNFKVKDKELIKN